MTMKLTREEIINLLNAGTVATAWITNKGAIIRFTSGDVGLLPTSDFDDSWRSFSADRLFVVDGVKGLAAIDTEWDGKDLATCVHGKTHNADWLKHDQLWQCPCDPEKPAAV